MRTAAAGIVCLVLAGAILLLFGGDSTAVKAVAVAVLGVAAVVAVSLAFFAVGRAEDEDRAAATPPPPEPEPEPEPVKHDTHERPALSRRRPLPPRRPS